MDLSFYPTSDQPRITSLVTQYGIVYTLELVKYYDNSSQAHVDEVTSKSNIFWYLYFARNISFINLITTNQDFTQSINICIFLFVE